MNESATQVPWRCFHCEAVFTEPQSAAEHFGTSERQQPACQIDIAEYRRMEEVDRRHGEEDTDLHRQIHAAQCEGASQARRAEEAGYARGLAQAQKHPAELGLAPVATSPQFEPAEGSISIQEAWEAAGGHPGIRASREELLGALRSGWSGEFKAFRVRRSPAAQVQAHEPHSAALDLEAAATTLLACEGLAPLGEYDGAASGCVRWREGVTRSTLSGETFHSGAQLRLALVSALSFHCGLCDRAAGE